MTKPFQQWTVLPHGKLAQIVAHHFCAHCGCATFSDSPTFEPDGKWDGSTRRIGVNVRLFDDFDVTLASIAVIDGKHLW